MTAVEIINEIKSLPAGEQARVAKFVREWRPLMTPEELGKLGEQLAGESDPQRSQALMDNMTSGFYGEDPHA